MVIGVALDESADHVRPLTEGISFPVLLDRDHVLAELYAVSNVPTVIWIDEDGAIARPNSAEVGTDMFLKFTGVRPEQHMDQVREWVQSGTLPADAATEIPDLNAEEIEARLAFRIAVHLRRLGEPSAADWFATAVELAPLDFTVRRAAMPLQDLDPSESSSSSFSLSGTTPAAPTTASPAANDISEICAFSYKICG